mmetsp:Transcript_16490/g.31255  ORF Transcript_16490/g.31255 Transcript_16490/m.31255 type:complete len:978 (+) Transcript_16490:568-3501(+)
MKLIGFAPWQHVATSVPQSSNIDDIIYKTVGRASPGSSFKRVRTSQDHGKSIHATLNEQPDLVLTTDHQISIISHTSSKKILKGSSVGDGNAVQRMKELTQWIYTSRPGEQSSFLPKSSGSQSLRVGAVVDAHSRSVISLQKDNTTLKIWSLDDDLTGPDEAEDTKLVDKIDLPSAVVCMETIPFSRQSRVRIKEQNGSSQDEDYVQGGVVGLLMDGQLFIILVSSSRKIKIGFFGNKESTSTSTRSKRRSTSASQNINLIQNHIFAAVGYSAGGSADGAAIEVAGQKRKAVTMEVAIDNLGDVTLTTLSLDPKNLNNIIFCKHIVKLSSFKETDDIPGFVGDSCRYGGINGVYQKEEGKLSLPNEIHMPTSNGNVSSPHNIKSVHITQLDQTHVGFVYQSSDSQYFGTILDMRYGECVVRPFRLAVNSSKAFVVDIGGLSTSILAVMTSDNCLSIYDVRRSIILYQTSVDELLGLDGMPKYTYRITSDWISGTIGIIRKNRNCENGTREKVHVSFSRIGIFDSSLNREESGAISKPLLKGSYNLARAIASSMATTASMDYGVLDPELAPFEQNMISWLTSKPVKSDDGQMDAMVDAMETLMNRLDKIRNGQKNGSRDTLCKVVSDCKKISFKVISPKAKSGIDQYPQRIVDAVVGVAIEVALAAESNSFDKTDAISALMICIRSGKFDGRSHFDKAFSSKSNNVLRSLLSLMKRMLRSEASTKPQIEESPLYLVCCLVKFCDSLSEHMLVSMVHFVLCHVSDEELTNHWKAMSKNDKWYANTTIDNIEKRLNEVNPKQEECDQSKNDVEILERRLAISQKMFIIERIITHSRCNTALLREALREGITHADKGEVEVLMHLLARLLRKAGRHSMPLRKGERILNISSCISQWLSALVDANLGMLMKSLSGDGQFNKIIEATRKEISVTVSQTQALVNLNEFLDHAQVILENSNHDRKSRKNLDVSPPPLYGIESLIF